MTIFMDNRVGNHEKVPHDLRDSVYGFISVRAGYWIPATLRPSSRIALTFSLCMVSQ